MSNIDCVTFIFLYIYFFVMAFKAFIYIFLFDCLLDFEIFISITVLSSQSFYI